MRWADLVEPRLTWASLIRLVAMAFMPFVLIAVVNWYWGSPDVLDTARVMVVAEGPAAAEEVLIDHLERKPGDVDAWLLLFEIRFLGLDTSDLMQTVRESIEVLKKLESRGEPRRSWRSKEELVALIDRAVGIPADVLRSYVDVQERGLAAGLDRLDPVPGALARRVSSILCERRGDQDGAARYAEAWFRADPTPAAAEAWFRLTRLTRGQDAARRLLDEEGVERALPSEIPYKIALEEGRVVDAARWAIVSHYETWTWSLLIGSFVILFAWGGTLVHLAGAWRWGSTGVALMVVAVVLGIASADLTLGVVVIMDELWPIDKKGGVPATLLLSLAIGVREELVKLLCFVPLALVCRGRPPIHSLLIASLVGLGFAVSENTVYYEMSRGLAVPARFLTANFLHAGLTGLAGCYLVDAMRGGGERWHTFLSELSKVIAIHAAYDFFLIEPSLREYSIVSSIFLIVLAQQYLRFFRQLAPKGMRRPPMTRVFLVGVTVAFGVHYLYMATQYGPADALPKTGMQASVLAITAIVYFREFGERVE